MKIEARNQIYFKFAPPASLLPTNYGLALKKTRDNEDGTVKEDLINKVNIDEVCSKSTFKDSKDTPFTSPKKATTSKMISTTEETHIIDTTSTTKTTNTTFVDSVTNIADIDDINDTLDTIDTMDAPDITNISINNNIIEVEISSNPKNIFPNNTENKNSSII